MIKDVVLPTINVLNIFVIVIRYSDRSIKHVTEPILIGLILYKSQRLNANSLLP